jgi:glycosyltransferase involved in cell wall biosynthesis
MRARRHDRIAVAANVPDSFRMLLRAQLDAARAAGWEVHCVSGPGAYLAELARDGFPVHTVPLTRLFDPAADARALAALVRLFRRERFALVHTHTPKTALLGQLAARVARVPRVVNTVHGLLSHDDDHGPRRWALAVVDHLTCALSSAVLSQSREDVERAIERRMCRQSRISHLGQGIDLARFDRARVLAAGKEALRARVGIPPTALVIAMVARFTKEKGYPEFLAMARRVAQKRADAHFLVVGTSIRERDVVRVTPESQGLKGRMTVLVDRTDMPEVYGAADLVVLPTYREGFPRSLVEASAMGIPVVATQIRGCREAVLDGQTGLLVPPGDVDALYYAVAKLADDPARRLRMSDTAARRARLEFDERRVCERVVGLYAELLGDPGRRRSPYGAALRAPTGAPIAAAGARR